MKISCAVLLTAASLIATISSTNAFSTSFNLMSPFGDMIKKMTGGGDVATAASEPSAGGSGSSSSLPRCPPGTQNCIRTAWTAPAGTRNLGATVLEILSSYPQEGQSGVDKGGWTVAEGNLKSTGKARLEFKSGIGNFAKLFNGGKPFIDDLQIEIVKNVVEIRSASRIGKSDLGVNKKRLEFLASKARALGWEAPEPKY